ncbi:hypothetical protein [Nocardia sp. NBC_01388]|uniref:hypothetical protein n=1 Tax=Nocardia sp. NBC_01388 TaxID=2903596 RepID=UPI0032520574
MRNISTTREFELWYSDECLLGLDPDVAELFAEVEDILCQARAPRNQLPHTPIPGSGHRHESTVREFDPPRARGRRPPAMPGTGRGPPGSTTRPHIIDCARVAKAR